MRVLWDFECNTCSTREERMVENDIRQIPCSKGPCGGLMSRIMGGTHTVSPKGGERSAEAVRPKMIEFMPVAARVTPTGFEILGKSRFVDPPKGGDA
jgi:hypothetical protein